MKRFLLLLLCQITLFTTKAQEGFEPGYVILNSGEKASGKILDRKKPYSVNSWQKILFINDKGEKEKFKPDDLKGYVKKDTVVYQTLTLGIEERKTFVRKIENGAIIIFADIKAAMPQQIEKGIYVTIYNGNLKQNIDGEFYLQTQNDPRTLMQWRARDYKMTAKYFFREDKDLVKQIEEEKYGYSDLQTIVRLYNEWKVKQ